MPEIYNSHIGQTPSDRDVENIEVNFRQKRRGEDLPKEEKSNVSKILRINK